MNKLIRRFPMFIVIAVGIMFMALFAACAGVAVPTTSSPTTITGTVKSVDAANGSVTLTVNGQDVTINGLSSAQVSQLQSQVGKSYTITAIQNSDGTFTITTGSNTITIAVNTPEGIQTPSSEGTPGETSGTPAAGTISFYGKVQSSGNNSVTVSMPNGSQVSVATNAQTDLGDFNNALPGVGSTIKVEANANTDGSYTATKLSQANQDDLGNTIKLNTVDFQGVTTAAVGSDRVVHFTVGNKSYSYTLASTADLGDFNGNAQGIQANQQVKVEVLFNGATGSITKVSSNNGQ